ncbi:LysR family transcriptional regulator [Microbispora sp. NPDC049125]|uniref:LysR family transcriptional regulator n=1 Tax=Microbispora sp. NPDC049125 TaxID=3154929 RepID=UPI0034670B36
MTPELRHLRYFVAVADRLSFTRAAEDLRVAQQSLSQQITVLERTLGLRLFDRDTRGTRLSEAGRVFLPEARAVLARAEEAVAVAGRVARGEIGRLRLAFLGSTTHYMLPTVVRAFRERFPEVELTTDDVGIGDLVAGLREGRYEAAFTRPPLVGDLATRTLITEPVCAVLPAGHPLAGRAELRLADLAGEPWVLTPRESWPPWHRKYDEEFRAAGFEPRVEQRASSVPGLLGLVAAGVGVTRLARSARTIRRTGVVFVPLAGERAETVVAWRPEPGDRVRGVPDAGGQGGGAPDVREPVLANLLTLVTELAASADLTQAG